MQTDIEFHTAWQDIVDKYLVSKKTANYWKLVAEGKPLPDNEFHRIKYEISHPPIRDKYGRDWYLPNMPIPSAYARGTPLPWGGPYHEDLISLTERLCQNKLLEAVRDYPLNIGVALAEYRETSDFVASCITSVAKSYRRMKKLQFRAAFRELGLSNPSKDWANKWLQWKYAVKPTLQDAYGACLAYHTRSQGLDRVFRYEVKASKTSRFSDESEWDWPDHNGRSQIIGKVRCHGVLRFGVTDPLVRRFDQLGVLNPALLIWEKIPYSFVLDWFIPVGNWLTNVVPPQGVKFLGGTLSTYIQGGGFAEDYWNQSSIYGGKTSLVNNWEKQYKRKKLTGFPSYTFEPVDLSMTVNRMVTALALLTQVRTGR
jgi:hypothetical protein